MYFRDFEEPPVNASWNTEWGGVYGYDDGWRESSVDEIQCEAERRAGPEAPSETA